MTKYGIKYLPSGKLLGFSATSTGDAEFCVGVEFTLEKYSDGNVWMVNSREVAETVMGRKGDWFNAGYESPLNPYEPSELKVVEITFKVEMLS